ncbi:MAG: hemolysin family protein [Firmicutes bacterium]|nr:hemolysin family protein [Bacillota bacterium]
MGPYSIGLLVAIIALLILNATFSVCETSYSAANKVRLRTLDAGGNKRAAKTLRLLEKFDKVLTTILVGNTAVTVTGASLTTLFAIELLKDTSLESVATVLSTVILTAVVLIFCEITPKTLAKEAPEKAAMALYPFLFLLMYVLWPLTVLFSLWKKLLKKVFRIKNEAIITEDELLTYVETAESEGGIKSHAGELIRQAIEFEDINVEDVMVPRVNVIAVSESDSFDDIKKKFRENGFIRMPVYSGSMDSILGILHQKDFYEFCIEGKKKVKDVLRHNLVVARVMKISTVLRMLQKAKVHMAVVVDEFGGTSGIVTLEDILEELVGEIYDEHDDEEILMRKIDDETYIITGTEKLSDMFSALKIKGDEEFDSTTVGGFATEVFGRIPAAGEQATYGRLEITVTKANVKRVLEVKLRVLPEEAEE